MDTIGGIIFVVLMVGCFVLVEIALVARAIWCVGWNCPGSQDNLESGQSRQRDENNPHL